MDYIDKNILRRLSNYEDVSLFAALILKVKYWGKILRSKDNSLTKDLIIKNVSKSNLIIYCRLITPYHKLS